jgi:hypothetical protein
MKTGLSQRQRWFYFGLVKKAVAIEMHGRVTWTKAEEENCRHELTRIALGYEKSSTQFTQREFDKVIAHLQSIVQPDNLSLQLRQLKQENKRAIFVVNRIAREMGKDRNFINGVIQQIEDGVDPNNPSEAWQREREHTGRRRTLEELTVSELKRVMDALRSIKRRGAKGRDYILK